MAAELAIDTKEAKRTSNIPLPQFDELVIFRNSVRSYQVLHGGKHENDTAVIRLENGGEYWMSPLVLNLLKDSGYEGKITSGDTLTLWVTNKKEATLDGKVPAIYQIMEGNEIYVRYEDVYTQTEKVRNRLASIGDIIALVFAGIGVVTYLIYMLLFLFKMYIPKTALIKMGFSKEDFEAWTRYRSKYTKKCSK